MKKQKGITKQAVKAGLDLILKKLSISKPTSKTEALMNKLSKKLTDRLLTEMKKRDKKKVKELSQKQKSKKSIKAQRTSKTKSV